MTFLSLNKMFEMFLNVILLNDRLHSYLMQYVRFKVKTYLEEKDNQLKLFTNIWGNAPRNIL